MNTVTSGSCKKVWSFCGFKFAYEPGPEKIRLYKSTLLRFVPFCYLKTKAVEVRTIRLLCGGAGAGRPGERTVGWIAAWLMCRHGA